MVEAIVLVAIPVIAFVVTIVAVIRDELNAGKRGNAGYGSAGRL